MPSNIPRPHTDRRPTRAESEPEVRIIGAGEEQQRWPAYDAAADGGRFVPAIVPIYSHELQQ